MTSEISFETSMQMDGQSFKVKGKYDAVIHDETRVPVMSWEFKNLKDDLTDKDTAQLVATMCHGIEVTRAMVKYHLRTMGFVTSGRQWVMVTANLVEGDYKWSATPVITMMGPDGGAVVGIDVFDQVAKLLCFAFVNAKLLHNVAVAATLRQIGPLDFSGFDGGRPLGNVDTNRTAPLTTRNVQKCSSLTRSQKPLDRFKTAPSL